MRTKIVISPSVFLLATLGLSTVVGIQATRGATNYPALPVTGAEYVFAAPYGWNRVQATTLGLGVWLHPGDKGYTQNIAARADNFNGTLTELAQKMITHIKTQHPDAVIGLIERTKVCVSHPAVYVAYKATVEGHPLMYEQMLTLYGTTAYAATYARAVNQSAIAAARQSLTTLCGGHAPPGTVATPVPAVVRTPTPTPSVLTNINTPQPAQTLGAPAATVTPRLGGP